MVKQSLIQLNWKVLRIRNHRGFSNPLLKKFSGRSVLYKTAQIIVVVWFFLVCLFVFWTCMIFCGGSHFKISKYLKIEFLKSLIQDANRTIPYYCYSFKGVLSLNFFHWHCITKVFPGCWSSSFLLDRLSLGVKTSVPQVLNEVNYLMFQEQHISGKCWQRTWHHFPSAECSEKCSSFPGHLPRELSLFYVCIHKVRKLVQKEHYRSGFCVDACIPKVKIIVQW